MATARLARPQYRYLPIALLCYLVLTWVPVAISVGLFTAWGAFTGEALPLLSLTIFLLIFRQVNVFTVSSLFHRSYSHKQFDYHPFVEHSMRVWNWVWLGTGGYTWATMHRWHHAESDSDNDPHSPTKTGGSLWNVTQQTASSYQLCLHHPERFEKYSKGLPNDRFEDFVRFFESKGFLGLVASRIPVVTLALWALPGISLPVALMCLPSVMGSAWYSTVMLVNGLCHVIGYRIWDNGDTSTNLFPIDIFGWGEALHHNHHERQSRANLGHAKWEFDSGFWMLWLLSKVGVVRNLRA
jgi:stearoyl-CoA desaturase (delta-9 desaturase)